MSLRFIIVFVLALPFLLYGEETFTSTGTLVVSYQTGPKAERLDRVRFWLKDAQTNNSQIYPKGDAYVNDHTCLCRLVVVEDLPAGKYTLTFIVPNADNLFEPIQPREVVIASDSLVKVDQVIKPRYASLRASTVLPPESAMTAAALTLYNMQGLVSAQANNGKMTANYLAPGTYTLVFAELAGYRTPEKQLISLGPDESLGPLTGTYVALGSSKQGGIEKTVPVLEGQTVIGDPFTGDRENVLPAKSVHISAFEIGQYEVTNAHFAQWLNKALGEKKIAYHLGAILDLDGHLLCHTTESNADSQIVVKTNEGKLEFQPAAAKQDHPVILVSWYGAKAYCNDYSFRLPTEAEWEKAAGMVNVAPGAPAKKYRFGFSRDRIDPTWANYKESAAGSNHVKTTPVGYFDGTHPNTHKATSPVGAYDMSGNVWEWVADWYDDVYYHNMPLDNPKGPAQGTKKVAKGGCYDSFADGVRVAERIGLDPEHADAFTGFRAASG